MMRALQIEGYSDQPLAKLIEMPERSPRTGEARVRVTAAALNPLGGGSLRTNRVGMTVSAVVCVSTPHGSHYIQQLCKHWTHKFQVPWRAGAERQVAQ